MSGSPPVRMRLLAAMRASDIFSMAGDATWLVQALATIPALGDASIPLPGIARLGMLQGSLNSTGLSNPKFGRP